MTEKVLIIDDEQAFRVVLRSALESEGYVVTAEGTGADGMRTWRKEAPDLVILDRNLPDADGVDVLTALRGEAAERNVDTVFLIVTAYADVENAVEALKRGADDYLTKPVQLSDLLVKLRKAIETRRLKRKVEALKHGTPDPAQLLDRTESAAMRAVLEIARKVASSPDTPVLIDGESGAGKDLLARYIHALTPQRSDAALVQLNCAAINEQLVESELFGHERGAFTDAKTAKRGILELAHEGTLFLDEIADLAPHLQAKLLRVLETMEFRRVGGTTDLNVNVRVISATNRDLARAVQEGAFRLDLYHRLDVFRLHLPPLRERREDILPLSLHFMTQTASRLGKRLTGIDRDAQSALLAYPYPGNVRELKNVIERAVILEAGTSLSSKSMVLSGPALKEARGFFSVDLDEQGRPPPFRDIERLYFGRVLEITNWNKTQAARLLDVSFPTINKKIADYSLKPG